jgi:putative protease
LPAACSKDYVEILNSDILCMADRADKFRNTAFFAVLLHDEDSKAAIDAIKGNKPSEAVTRGLYYRGVCENYETHI